MEFLEFTLTPALSLQERGSEGKKESR